MRNILAVCFVLLIVARGASQVGSRFVANSLNYVVTSDSEVMVEGTASTIGDSIKIPPSVEFQNSLYNVTSVDESAFWGCSWVVDVSLPPSIVNIFSSAFRNCKNLVSINIPPSVVHIGDNAFDGCSEIRSVQIVSPITNQGSNVFSSCVKLTTATVCSDALSLGTGFFWGCSSLTSVTIVGKISEIGDYAFFGCEKLSDVSLPSSVRVFGSYSYAGCKSLSSLPFASSLQVVGSNAFQECDGLRVVRIPSTVISVGENAFAYCDSLSICTLPPSVDAINESTFLNCTSLDSVSLPAGVTKIAASAFRNCKHLRSVAIPPSVISLGDYAFYSCSSLCSVSIPHSVVSIGQAAFSECIQLKSIVIPPSVTTIGMYAFSACANLEKASLHSCSIGEYIFAGCSSISQLVMNSDNPRSANSYTFKDFDKSNCYLYVPSGTGSLFKAHNNWQGFKDVIEMSQRPALVAQQRNSLLKHINDTISCYSTKGAVSYWWRLINNATGVEYLVNTENDTSLLISKTGVPFNSKITVYVDALVDGNLTGEGIGYAITTPVAPVTRLGAQFHNHQMKSLNELVIAIKVPGTTFYLFQFVDEKTGARFRHYNKGNSIRVSDVTGVQPGCSYQVTVLPRFNNSLSQFSVGARIYTPK